MRISDWSSDVCSSDLSGVFNVGSGVGRSLNQIVASLERVLERKITVQYGPPRGIDVPISVLDCTLAARELGWRAASDWEGALKVTCDWIAGNVKNPHARLVN